jgi:hypothetical protein
MQLPSKPAFTNIACAANRVTADATSSFVVEEYAEFSYKRIKKTERQPKLPPDGPLAT